MEFIKQGDFRANCPKLQWLTPVNVDTGLVAQPWVKVGTGNLHCRQLTLREESRHTEIMNPSFAHGEG
jgi:hypothetical protein